MILIGICGASGSGKTTLAAELVKEIGEDAVVINQDAYYLDHPDLTYEERCRLNYDEPFIFDHDLLYQDICTLMSGTPVYRKGYDFTTHRRADTQEMIHPASVVIVEGIHCFYDKKLCDLMFLKLFIQVEPDECLLRRISRDIKDRGRDIDSIGRQYLSTVKPMYDRYIRNYIHDADVVVTKGGKNARIVPILGGYLKNELEKERLGAAPDPVSAADGSPV